VSTRSSSLHATPVGLLVSNPAGKAFSRVAQANEVVVLGATQWNVNASFRLRDSKSLLFSNKFFPCNRKTEFMCGESHIRSIQSEFYVS